jgi:hypothetical protein
MARSSGDRRQHCPPPPRDSTSYGRWSWTSCIDRIKKHFNPYGRERERERERERGQLISDVNPRGIGVGFNPTLDQLVQDIGDSFWLQALVGQ